MRFVLQTPSLQHAAGVKIVTHLWNQRDSFTQIAQSFNNLPSVKLNADNIEWKAIEEKVKSKVWALPILSKTCKEKLLNFIKPIGMEIINWCKYHNLENNSFKLLLPPQLYWSMHGAIDYAKTAELIVKDERLDVERRFEIACLNCLEDEARKLFELIPYQRINFNKYLIEAAGLRNRFSMDHRILVAYFACTLSGHVDLLNRLFQAMDLRGGSVNQYLFKVVLREGTRATCEYFFQRVSYTPERELVFFDQLPLRPTHSPACGSMLCWSLVNEERLFRENDILSLLTLLLRWPMQPLFVKTITRTWRLMDSYACAMVLADVIYKIRDGFEDYDYARWFKVLWRFSSTEQKHLFLNNIYQLENLIATKRKEFIQLVFNAAPSRLLKELVEEKYRYERISDVLMDEKVISETALVECKRIAALKSSKDPPNKEKRLRSEHLSRLVDPVMERRIKSKRKYIKFDTVFNFTSICNNE